jgi:hypothetical protein
MLVQTPLWFALDTSKRALLQGVSVAGFRFNNFNNNNNNNGNFFLFRIKVSYT